MAHSSYESFDFVSFIIFMSKLQVYRTYFHDFMLELVQSNFCDGRKIGLNLKSHLGRLFKCNNIFIY